MTLYLLKIGKWLLSKVAVLLIATAVAVGAFALYLYVGDSIRADRERMAKLQEAQEMGQVAYEKLENAHTEILFITNELNEAREKLKLANELVERLEGFLSKLEYLFLSESEKKKVDNELALANNESSQLGPLIESLRVKYASLRVDRTNLSDEVRSLEEKIASLESSSSEMVRYIDNSWNVIKVYLPIALTVVIAGPIVLKLIAFYIIAPIFRWVRPVKFSDKQLPVPMILDSGVSVSLKVREGEQAWIKESYLQASDEGLARRTRFVLNWQIPITCLAAGLIELVEFASENASMNGAITASTQNKPDMELSLVEIPENGSLILRPSHLVGLIGSGTAPVSIRRRWSFDRAQAWMTLQFRYFEFVGPCRMVVSGIRGVRSERILSTDGKGRRANQDSTIGFTPDLEFGAARAEAFWAYFRGFNPLFDDVFRGEGTFFCQEISKGEASGPVRFWVGLRDAFLKIVGI